MTDAQPHHLRLINHLFELEKRLAGKTELDAANRIVGRMKGVLDELGYLVHNPLGEKYDITRSDCQASVVGDKLTDLVIVDVVKPLVHLREDQDRRRLIQQGVVIVSANPH